jgi:4-carboxymuconolactone decarboxylase
MMSETPPRRFTEFVERYPDLGESWEGMRRAEENGPLDERTRRLIKLAVAIGAQRSGSVSSGVRKGLDAGIALEELEHVVALGASTIGLPASVAAWGWMKDAVEKRSR